MGFFITSPGLLCNGPELTLVIMVKSCKIPFEGLPSALASLFKAAVIWGLDSGAGFGNFFGTSVSSLGSPETVCAA